jgi:prepilin-type N-terminal cleavage/methylation domain-containing protein
MTMYPKKAQGFTLIEVMVSVAIFSVVMVMALGALLALSTADRKAESLKAAINNLNFALDAMSRSIRTGTNYHCDASALPVTATRDCPGGVGAASVSFHSASGIVGAGDSPYLNSQIVFCLGSGTVCDSASGTSILFSSDGGLTYTPITAPEVVITKLLFYVVGSARSGGVQPIVLMTLSGYVQVSPTQQTPIHFQSAVTQRLYNL